jgi:hypothetical protein
VTEQQFQDNDRIKERFEETIRSKVEPKRKNSFSGEIEKAERNLSGNDWDNTSKSKLGVFGFRFFAMSLKKNRLNMPRQMFEKAKRD